MQFICNLYQFLSKTSLFQPNSLASWFIIEQIHLVNQRSRFFFLSIDKKDSLVDKMEMAKEIHLNFSKASGSVIQSVLISNMTKWSKRNHDRLNI